MPLQVRYRAKEVDGPGIVAAVDSDCASTGITYVVVAVGDGVDTVLHVKAINKAFGLLVAAKLAVHLDTVDDGGLKCRTSGGEKFLGGLGVEREARFEVAAPESGFSVEG